MCRRHLLQLIHNTTLTVTQHKYIFHGCMYKFAFSVHQPWVLNHAPCGSYIYIPACSTAFPETASRTPLGLDQSTDHSSFMQHLNRTLDFRGMVSVCLLAALPVLQIFSVELSSILYLLFHPSFKQEVCRNIK